MTTLPHLTRPERRRLQKAARNAQDPKTCLRMLAVGHVADGLTKTEAARCLRIATSTVVDAVRRYCRDGLLGLHDQRCFNGQRKVDGSFLETLRELLRRSPEDFGWQRTTWSRELLCEQMEIEGHPRVAVCTMSRALSEIGAKLRRPKPIVICPWPRKVRLQRVRELEELVAGAMKREPVFYSDEVDIHLNPKIGPAWMLPGERHLVVTPGKNKKHYLAGALDVRTGEMTYVEGDQKASWLFCKLLWRLASENPKAKRIHLVVDNYIIHKSKITQGVLESLGGRIVLHFLPPYCPQHNLIEQVWGALHASITRNHRCRSMKELLRNVYDYLDAYEGPPAKETIEARLAA